MASGAIEFETPPDPFPPEFLDIITSTAQAAAVTDLGDLPVYVLTATLTTGQDGNPITRVPEWRFELQGNLLALSTNSTQQLLEATHITIWWAKPEAVVEAVAWVTAEAR